MHPNPQSHTQASKLKRALYEEKLAELHLELVKMQYWIKETGQKVVVIFEGRDAAGKGGAIKCVTKHEARSTKHEARSTKHEARSTKHEARNEDPHLFSHFSFQHFSFQLLFLSPTATAPTTPTSARPAPRKAMSRR